MKRLFFIGLCLVFMGRANAQDPAYPAAPPAPQPVIRAEYFIDTDPGIGNASAIAITAATNISNTAAAINTTGLSNGIHRLFLRTRNTEGSWSITAIAEFLVDANPAYPAGPAALQNIIRAEYFIDTDPGIGNATAISLTPGVDISDLLAVVNTTGLSAGTHRIFLRTRNNEGSWSITDSREFLLDTDPGYPAAAASLQPVIRAEYFVDTDPGFGNGSQIALTPGTDIQHIAAAINTGGLAVGAHRLFLRSRNNEGSWSISAQTDFVVDNNPAYPALPASPQNIIRAEYYVDTDPGFGNGTSIPLTASVDIASTAFSVNTSGLSNGTHTLFIRSRNQEGSWSITQKDTFAVGILTVTPDTLSFGTVNIGANSMLNIVISNNSSTAQTITGVVVTAPFSSSFSSPISVNAGQSVNLPIHFTPLATGLFQSDISVQTSTGSFEVYSVGAGQVALPAFTIEPATGHNYGNVQVGSSNNFVFTVRNTGNVPISLIEATSSQSAFIPSFSAATLPVGGSINVPVLFSPSAVTSYAATLKIKSAAGGADSVTVSLLGNGFTPATPPVLNFVPNSPYNGVSGINPQAGQTGIYTYKVLYRSADNRAPAMGYPKIGIDRTGDQDFDDLGEGLFPMTAETTGTDYVTGVVYTYSINYPDFSNTLGYRFFAQDALGNAAATAATGYNNGPIVTFQTLDLKLFANDISFSKTNPAPGELFTVNATLTNNSAFNAVNVPVSFYRDTILIGSTIVPAINAFSTAAISRTLSFAADGFYPIKVWIDPDHTLNENNILNNYAIRPVIVGTPTLPGGITVTATTSLQNCPAQKIIFTGHADYFGTSIPTAVAGAAVTITTQTAVLHTTTDAAGNFNLVMENPPCGNTIIYTVSVTDFTFTSSLFTGSVNVPCPATNSCGTPPVPAGGAAISVSSSPCATVSGTTTNANLTIKYRGRNEANMWSLWDKIWKDTVKVFSDGVLIQTIATPDIPNFGSAGTFPGDEKIIPVTIPVGSAGPHVITVVATYVYNEFFQNEDNFYHGVFTPITVTATTTLFATPARPDLTLENFKQPSFRTLTFDDTNLECVSAGSHVVSVVDLASGALVQSTTVSSVGGKSSFPISVDLSSLSFGTHTLRVITDTTALVDESNEDNNIFLVTLTIPRPDLIVSKVVIHPTSLSPGSTVLFDATIKNTGTIAGASSVRFLANGVPIGGDIPVAGIPEGGSIVISSNGLVVSTADFDCPIDITVIADAGGVIPEESETNNSFTFKLGSDINPAQLPIDYGSSANPQKVRVNTTKVFNVHIRNTGTRDITNVTVKFMHNGTKIGEALIPLIVAGKDFPAAASFTHTFTTAGVTTVQVVTDTANAICEIDETNNTGDYHVNVTDSKEDFEVLSQYISPSSLNPNLGQNITIVGTVKNIGNRVAPPSTLRFYVDDLPLGNPVPFNSLQIGQDTTVAATVTYPSPLPGVKVVKIVVDEEGLVSEEDENNNLATRILIVGDAPDMARVSAQSIRFNPSGFHTGDVVTVSQQIVNNGPQGGTAWIRFLILDESDAVIRIDSTQFTLAGGANTTVSKQMVFDVTRGTVITQIVNCSPLEFDLLNNNDTLAFSTVGSLRSNLTVGSDLDMQEGIQDQLPGWIGGKLLLGDYDLIINGNINSFDTAHFVITNGSGKLKLVNNSPENVFPVGTALFSPNFARIHNTGTPDHYSVRVVPYVLENGNTGDTIAAGYVNRTWLIEEEVAGGSNATVELFWKAGHELPGFERTASKLTHYTSQWEAGSTGNAIADTTGSFSRTQSGYTGFSPFAVTSLNGTGLPLRFISFTATKENKDVRLLWVTDNEVNSSHFDIEYSPDGIGFVKAGSVLALNSGGRHTYNFTHLSAPGPVLYYRIRQVDRDGRYSFSMVVRVSLPSGNGLVVYPNPATTFIQIKNIEVASIREIKVQSMEGKQVAVWAPNSQLRFDISRLTKGVYTIIIIRNDQTIITREFIRQ